MNKEQKQASNFQAKHNARKSINWEVAQLEDSKTYWNEFYNPFNDFLLLLNKRELAFIYDKAVSDPDSITEICEDATKASIGGQIIIKMQFKNNSHPEQIAWFDTLPTKCYLICENGQDLKI